MATDCQPVTIFEGPDGGGKTTAARAYAEITGSVYVHFGPLSNVRQSLPRLYVEAMLPALLGYQPVVLDRCWLSEGPYARVYRDGRVRTSLTVMRMLERLAWRAGAVVVKCLPSFETCVRSFQARPAEEYLDNVGRLKAVYDEYAAMKTDLCVVEHDYTMVRGADWLIDLAHSIQRIRPVAHPLWLRSAGNWNAKVVLVGEKFGSLKDSDPLYQWPFASFAALGCSRWLTGLLEDHAIPEDELLWVNADELIGRSDCLELSNHVRRPLVLPLGNSAHEITTRLTGRDLPRIRHPQAYKRFYNQTPSDYELISHLKERFYAKHH